MDTEWMARQLPETPPKGMVSWAKNTHEGDLGTDNTIICAERQRVPPQLAELMEGNSTEGKSVWVESCTCAVCGESYYAEKTEGMDGFYIRQGDDGCTYPVSPGGDLNEGVDDEVSYDVIPVCVGDTIVCPICGANTTIAHARDFRGGRKKQLQVATLHAVEGYAVIVYWLVYRIMDTWGGYSGAEPRYAYVLGPKGGLTCYSHRKAGAYGNDHRDSHWHLMSSSEERWDTKYHDWGSYYDTKSGTVLYPYDLPSLEGTTGEKTGLRAYWEQLRDRPIDYLRLWNKFKPIENLSNAGFGKLIEDVLGPYCSPFDKLPQVADLTKAKPHEILRMGKADFRRVKAREKRPGWAELNDWKYYRQIGGKLECSEFLLMADAFRQEGKRAALEMMETYHDMDFPKLHRYLVEKQNMRPWEAGILKDARNMASQINQRPLTQEELWPQHLQQFHDRLYNMIMAEKNEAARKKYQKGFTEVLEKYGPVQWNDGELAIILPRSNADLVREGSVLKHCVGGYGSQHSAGKKIIFFVRHYRRPERCYYTLNISFTGAWPTEIQLHGYGNERHGPYKQYEHSIPRKVREFVDRWEQEILRPWWHQQYTMEQKGKTA